MKKRKFIVQVLSTSGSSWCIAQDFEIECHKYEGGEITHTFYNLTMPKDGITDADKVVEIVLIVPKALSIIREIVEQ